MLNILVKVAETIGFVFGRFYVAFLSASTERARSNGNSREKATYLAIEVLGKQNENLVTHLMGLHTRLMEEVILEQNSEVTHEISCRTEHLSVIKSVVDDFAESAIKETASWASSVMNEFGLKLDRVSMEPETASDSGRSHDIVVIFHVRGVGDDALRFQAEASRRLKSMLDENDERSYEMLRVDVRWK